LPVFLRRKTNSTRRSKISDRRLQVYLKRSSLLVDNSSGFFLQERLTVISTEAIAVADSSYRKQLRITMVGESACAIVRLRRRATKGADS
jgi:hypothetical protein